jgi:hypothetical protein
VASRGFGLLFPIAGQVTLLRLLHLIYTNLLRSSVLRVMLGPWKGPACLMRASHISREGFLSGLLIGTLSRVVSGALLVHHLQGYALQVMHVRGQSKSHLSAKHRICPTERPWKGLRGLPPLYRLQGYALQVMGGMQPPVRPTPVRPVTASP